MKMKLVHLTLLAMFSTCPVFASEEEDRELDNLEVKTSETQGSAALDQKLQKQGTFSAPKKTAKKPKKKHAKKKTAENSAE